MRIEPVSVSRLAEYATIPMTCAVTRRLCVEAIDGGLGGLRLAETAVEPSYVKDYDDDGPPTEWPARFGIERWGLWIAYEGDQPTGGAAVAWNTAGVNVLEGRADLAVLWDVRVEPRHRRQGIGRALVETAVTWARERGCVELKIETQNINVAACRFYRALGCELTAIDTRAYADRPSVAHEAMLIWRLKLTG